MDTLLLRVDEISLQKAQLKYDVIVQILKTHLNLESSILDSLKKYKSEGIFSLKKNEDCEIQWEGS